MQVEIPETFSSGGFEGRARAALIEWLIEIGEIEDEDEFSPERHSHSEEEMVLHLRRDWQGYAAQLAQLLRPGEVVEAVSLDFVSYPNTVCGVCHRSVDELMNRVIVPKFTAAFRLDSLQGLVNASAVNRFPGSHDHPQDKASWAESLVDFGAIAKAEASARQGEEREARSRRRGARGESGLKKARTDSGKEEVAAEAVVAALGGAFGPFHRIGGEGLNCYIRSILTALSLRNIVAPGEVENLVDAISDHLDDVDLRLDEMIDAGGLAAAEVRRVIASLTTHVIHGGADVGITIVQWDYDDDSPAIFEANRGTQQVVLLYTPGHFDLLE